MTYVGLFCIFTLDDTHGLGTVKHLLYQSVECSGSLERLSFILHNLLIMQEAINDHIQLFDF